ncbi:unnamed protein product, partial [Cyprideis torosa]
ERYHQQLEFSTQKLIVKPDKITLWGKILGVWAQDGPVGAPPLGRGQEDVPSPLSQVNQCASTCLQFHPDRCHQQSSIPKKFQNQSLTNGSTVSSFSPLLPPPSSNALRRFLPSVVSDSRDT